MKMGDNYKLTIFMGMLVISVVGLGKYAEAADAPEDAPPCAQPLSPCVKFLNNTNPNDVCCNLVKKMVANDMPCLCLLFSTTGALEALGSNNTQGIKLIETCEPAVDFGGCKATAPTPAKALSPPPVPGKDNNGVGRISWTGTGTPVLIFFWALLIVSGGFLNLGSIWES